MVRFQTVTISAAHLEDFTGLMSPKVSYHCISTISLIEYGKVWALQNLETTDGSM